MSLPLYDVPKVGGDVLAWCTKCKMELAHVVIAMVGNNPKKVMCKTCKSQHNFKRQGVTTNSKRPGVAKPVLPKAVIRAADYWEKKMEERKSETFIPYDVKSVFQKGNLIQHTQFGVGIVEEVRSPSKIMVVFRVGEKVLVHGMAPQR